MENPNPASGRDGEAAVHSNPVSQAGFTMIPNAVVLDERLSIGAKLTYGYLKHLAWRNHSDTAESALATLCRDLAVSENTMRGYLRELADVDLVESQRRGLGLPNLYVVHDPSAQDLRDGTAETESPETEELRLLTSSTREDVDLRETAPDLRSRVRWGRDHPVYVAWDAHAPPLIAHRDGYLGDPKTRDAVKRAERTYPADAIADAIASYATCLAGDEYRWTYSWGLREFLQRGLDKFVPEARPLDNFRIRQDGTKFGRRDVSSREFLEAGERLKAKRLERERRALESG